MSIADWFKNLFNSKTVKTVETDIENIAAAGWAYIKTNGLQAAYQIAITLLTDLASGTQWNTILAHLAAQSEAAGISLEKGAEAIILAQAQSDLIAVGKLVAPSTGVVVSAS